MSRTLRLAATSLCLTGLLSVACASHDSPDPDSELGEQSEAISVAEANLAQWGSLVTLPIVPVSAANLPNGTVMLWSSEDRFDFGPEVGRTYSVFFDPATSAVTERLVNETQHDMFCPGTANLPDGRIFVNGGLTAGTTSIFDPLTSTWTKAANMNIPRAYQGTTPLQDGSVFTLGGSWAGGVGNKHGEVWRTNNTWALLPGVQITPFLSVDPTRNFGMDSHLWLLPAGNGRVFHAGPGMQMHWISTQGTGSVEPLGPRGDDEFSINGNAVMYDKGKVLKVGGAAGYDGITSNGNAYVMELGTEVTTRELAPMAYRRAFHNSVPLPNGQVVIIGGATVAVGFSDNNSVLAPEIFDPVSETFTVMPSMAVPRNYHSIALLLADGRVLSAGGGLCGTGCAANHPDLQILSPPYLFNSDGTPATRPVITTPTTQVVHGGTIPVTSTQPISNFSLVRMSSTTHALNNDQRRLPVTFTETAPNAYTVQVPSNPGWALPGQYFLFGMNANGTPSVAKVVRIGSTTILPLAPVPNKLSLAGDVISPLALSATSPSGNPLTYGATNLPPGLSINPSTGVISGTPTTVGQRLVEVSASDTLQKVSTEFVWEIHMGDNESPTLVQPSPAMLALGAPVSLQLQASDPDVGDVLTYSATSLPNGLTLNTATGLITGAATQTGTFVVTANVTDGRGGLDTVQFNWAVGVNPPTVSPVIAPLASLGTTGQYHASASGGGGGLQYSWSWGDGTPDTGFSSSPDASHKFAKAGVFIVTLTVRNAQGDYVSTEFVQAIATPAIAGTPRSSSNVIEELRAGLTPRVWVANIDNDTVSVFNRQGLTKVAEIPVGVSPRTLAVCPDGRVWVANKGSASLSIISPTTLSVVQTVALPRASQPFGVVCGADGSVYVALEGTGEAIKLDGAGVQLVKKAVGPGPRHLALTAAGDKVLMTRFITAPQPGEATAFVETTVGGVFKGAELMVLSPATLGKSRTIILRHSDKPDTTISGRGVPNYLGAPAISPDGLSAWVPSKQDNILRGSLRDGQNLDFQNTVRAIASRVALTTSVEDYAGRLDFDNSGVASAAAYHPSGAYLFVALEASRQVAVLDAAGKRELFRVDAGLAPQAVVSSADGRTLFVHNALGRSVSVYDLSALIDTGSRTLPSLGELDAVAVERLAPEVLLGKQLFYDARDTRLARDGYMSCASCHNDGGHDGRVWDLTGLGEGLRNTASLRGRAGAQGPQHWTGNFDEIQDFEGQIRALAEGTGLLSNGQFNSGSVNQPLGDPKTGLSADLDALAAYVESLESADASPFRATTGAMTSTAAAGRPIFARACVSCHGGFEFSDSPGIALHDVGTLRSTSGSRLGQPLLGLDTPGLRGSWATAPYLHDGSAATLNAAVLAHTSLSLAAADVSKVVAFVQQLGVEEPAVLPLPGFIGQYFANGTLSGPAVLTRTEQVKLNWGTAAPNAALPADGFSVRWSGQVLAPSTGNYRFRLKADDGVRLWVNGALVIDTWNILGVVTSTSTDIPLTAGQRADVRLEYHDVTGAATVTLYWLQPGSSAYPILPLAAMEAAGTGLAATYFPNATLAGSPVLTRYEAPHFDWGTGSPDPSVAADNFSARWTGTFTVPADGAYAFRTNSDDGVRLWVNNTLVIDNWTAHAPTYDYSPAVVLGAGYRYDIKLEWQEFGGGAVMQLDWQPPAGVFGPIPRGHLFAN